MDPEPITDRFDYSEAFSRNLGWVTPEEQQKLRSTVIGIPGVGGVGGHHLHALLRMGFCRFKIADLDQFEIQNFNRQFGATISSIGQEKVDVLRAIAFDINPECEIEVFRKGIQEDNIEDFLKDIDIICDGLDLYACHLRAPLYESAHDQGVYVVSAGPFGMGTALLVVDPKGMSFNNYFDLGPKSLTVEAKIIRFLAGMSPHLLHMKYVAYPKAVGLFEGRLPSLHAGCYSASAALSTAVLKIVLQRGKVYYAPHGYQMDFYRNKFKKFWRPFGNRNPLQKMLIKAIHHRFKVKEFG